MYLLGPLLMMILMGLVTFWNFSTVTSMKNMENGPDQSESREAQAFSAYVRDMRQAVSRYGRGGLDGKNIILHAQICKGSVCTGSGAYEGTTTGAWSSVTKERVTFCRGLTFTDGKEHEDSPNGPRIASRALDMFGRALPACTGGQPEPFTKGFTADEAVTRGFSNIVYGEKTLLAGKSHYIMLSWIYEPHTSQSAIIRLFDDGIVGTKRGTKINIDTFPDVSLTIPATIAALIPDGAAVAVSYPIPDLPGWRDDSGD